MRKIRYGGMSTTDLDQQLRERGGAPLVVSGISTSGSSCPPSSTRPVEVVRSGCYKAFAHFTATPPSPETYRLFLGCQHEGTVWTAAFIVHAGSHMFPTVGAWARRSSIAPRHTATIPPRPAHGSAEPALWARAFRRRRSRADRGLGLLTVR
ncbi:hypothetical protein [Streptomyces sp. NPDC002587]